MPLSVYSKEELLGHMVVLLLVPLGTSLLLSIMATPIYIPWMVEKLTTFSFNIFRFPFLRNAIQLCYAYLNVFFCSHSIVL
jgi:hypothetical protein